MGLIESSYPNMHYTVGPVLLVTPWYRPDVGGVAEVAERLHRTLTKAGVVTHTLVCEAENWHHIEAHPTVANVWRFRVPSYAFYRLGVRNIAATLIRGPLAFWQILRFVRSHQIRTLILLFPIEYTWPFLLLRYTRDIRLITSCHGSDITKYDIQPSLLRWLFRRVLRGSDAITVVADHLAEQAQKLFPDNLLPIRLIPNCVDINHFAPPPTSFSRLNTRPTLVHVSNFAPTKRTLDIIKAFAIARIPPESRLIMVGAGHDLEAAIERARSLGVDHCVEFVGSQKDVRPYLWQADLFVLASDDEGAPLVLLEAMACGLPWISTPWGAAAVLPPGECGVVVPSRSPDRLAIAMAELINDPQHRRAMGLQGRQRAEIDFGEDKYVDSHLQLIQEVETGAALAPVAPSSSRRAVSTR